MDEIKNWNIWLKSPLGSKLINEEKFWLDSNVEDIFGYHAVQICPFEYDFLKKNRIRQKYKLSFYHNTDTNKNYNDSFLISKDFLPFSSQSIDLLLLVHVVEILNNPHVLLREVERVMIPEGKLIICGFNPYGLWVFSRIFNKNQLPTCLGEWVGLVRLKDWCKLLGFEIIGGSFLAYYPAINSKKWLSKLDWMNSIGQRWWPMAGGVYCLSMVKRASGIKLDETKIWKTPKFSKKNIPSLSAKIKK